MRKIVDDERMMLRVCDLYYNRDLSQSEIAKLMDISRPTIAKLIKSAKQRRIVEITISDPQQRGYSELERRLEKMYKLQEVIVADSVEDGRQKDVLGKAAANYLKYALKDGDVVGVGSGTTLRYMVPYASKQFQNLVFVPLIGGNGGVDISVDSNHVADALAKAFGGEDMHLYVPALVSRTQTKKALMKEESVRKVMNHYDHLDVVIVGIGTANENSSAFKSGYYTDEMKRVIGELDVCGDICMHLYDANGNMDAIEYNQYVFSVNPNKFRKVPHAIGVASGVKKARAIRGAIKGGYINVLITDEKCAEELVQLGGL